MASQSPLEQIRPTYTGGSTGSQFSSRNPYRDSVDDRVSRSGHTTPLESPRPFAPHGTKGQQALEGHQTSGTTNGESSSDIYSSTPPLPPRPENFLPERPRLPPREGAEVVDSPHPGFTAPYFPHCPEQEETDRDGLPSASDEDMLPPRRRLTTGDVAVTSVIYARNAERLIAYLIPLPAPTRQGQVLDVPQRYLLYTPPAPHLLKPEGKEHKRHKIKRIAQQEVKKAKTFTGKTLSLRGLHSKTLRGCDWAVAKIKNTDITFLNRIPRKEVSELILIHPASVLEHQTPQDVHREFTDQLARTRRRAARDSLVSVALLPPALVVDTFAAVVWPFGGLAEIDGVWAYASVSGFLTARSVTKRLDSEPILTADEAEQRRLRWELRGDQGVEQQPEDPFGEQQDSRRDSRQVHFVEDLPAEEVEKTRADEGSKTKKPLKVRFVPDAAMDVMSRYFQEACHKRNSRAFPSTGAPPTKTDVLASIGWWPDRRGRAPGVEHEGDWDDENWQTQQVKEDLDKVMNKAAKSWEKWCNAYAKYPQRALKEKGHSRVSEALRKLHIKKDTPPTGAPQAAQ